MNRATRIAHLTAVGVMAVAVLIATADGFAQSWVGLYQWAHAHGLTDWKAKSFPLMVDVFILVGELGMFALALEGHKLTRRAMSWLDLAIPAVIAAAGWCVSLAFNVGRADHELSDQLTAAVPPIASMLGLLVLLRTLHRLVGRPSQTAADTSSDADQATQLDLAKVVTSAKDFGLSVREIEKAFDIKRWRVEKALREAKQAAEDPPADEVSESVPEAHTMNGHVRPEGA